MTDNQPSMPRADEGRVRHRRAERYAAPAAPRTEPAPLPETYAAPQSTPRKAQAAPHAARAKDSRAAPRAAGPDALRIGILTVLAICVVLCAFRYADSALRAGEERDRIQAELDARQALFDRHVPRYVDRIQYWAREYGIDPSFIKAVIYRESHYDPKAVSSAGARGLMQLMPDTGIWMAQKAGLKDYTDDSLFDPDTNIRLGTRYLKYLSGLFDGDPILVACAYHAGQGNVRTWIENHSSDGVHLTLSQIPMSDTRTYAERVMQSYAIYLETE